MSYIEMKPKGSGKFFKWDVIGKKFEGQYVGLGTGTYQNRQTFHARFVEKATGQEIRVNTPTVLRRRLEEEFVPGDRLLIEYTHDERGKQPQPSKMFKIYKDDDVAQAPQSVAASVPVFAGVAAREVPANPAVIDEYAALATKLREKNGDSAAKAMLDMLERGYADPVQRLDALKQTLKQQGAL